MQCSIKLCLLHDIFLYSPQLTSRKYIDFLGGSEITKYLSVNFTIKSIQFQAYNSYF